MLFAFLSEAAQLAIISLVGLVVKDLLDQRRSRIAQRKIDENTKVTVSKANEVVSAVQAEVTTSRKEASTAAATVAQKVSDKAIATATKVAEKVEEENKATKDAIIEMASKQDQLAEAINGVVIRKIELARKEGYNAGVIEGSQLIDTVTVNTGRIDRLEGQMAALEPRLVNVEQTTNRILQIVERK